MALTSCTEANSHRRFPLVEDTIRVHATVPERGAIGVAHDSSVDVCFSGLLDPRAIGNFDVVVSSGQNVFDTEQLVQLFAWRAPGRVDEFADRQWCPGSVLSIQNRETWAASILHRVTLRPSAVGWAGEGLDTTTAGWTENADGEPRFAVEFTIADDEPQSEPGSDLTSTSGSSTSDTSTNDGGDTNATGTAEPDPTDDAITLQDLFEPGQVFDPNAEHCSCHVRDDPLALARLDLSTPQRAWSDLVLETHPASTGFPLVSPRRPSSSHLVHVLLRDDDGTAIRGVLGAPMPPAASLPYPHLVSIARWIADGARFE